MLQLRSQEELSLRSLMHSFDQVAPREALVGSFCALLELVRLELIRVDQDEEQGNIQIGIHPSHNRDLESVVARSVLDEEQLRAGGSASRATDQVDPQREPVVPEGALLVEERPDLGP